MTVHGNNPKSAWGLLGARILVVDEPAVVPSGLWEPIVTSLGKQRTLILCVGTLHPAAPGHWWRRLVEAGSQPGVHVHLVQADRDAPWDDWNTIRRCTPLLAGNPHLRAALRREREEARRDTASKAQFMSLRLNLPTRDETAVLLTADDWRQVVARPVPPREGRPVAAVDLGAGRCWSGCTAVWPNGRVEAVAIAPGVPSLEVLEKRDRVEPGVYRRLVDDGVLIVDPGRQVQRGEVAADVLREWRPRSVACDRFRHRELQDVARGIRVQARSMMPSEWDASVRAVRKAAKDGGLAVAPEARGLLVHSLSVSKVDHDPAGNARMIKADRSGAIGRDDVAVSLALACGEAERVPVRRAPRFGLA